MIISRLYLRAFKSVFEMTMPIDPKITVIIGANESGKTNILKALLSTSSGMAFNNSLTCQYSDFYYQGKSPEIAVEYAELSKENRRNLLKYSESFKDTESFVVRKTGEKLEDYHVFINEAEVAVSEMGGFLKTLPKVLYFDDIPLLKSQATIEDLVGTKEAFRTERNLLRIGGVVNPELIFEDSTRGRRASESQPIDHPANPPGLEPGTDYRNQAQCQWQYFVYRYFRWHDSVRYTRVA